ncbi:terminase small subunit [Achromobacter denitrificans]|uniref:terminase small subunit n=1 Tax=Achromobacter denitrificans TaxID=32002 RepID=UPI0023E44EFB|nr:terminase small subunit [Achromobacter denitrificans]MDF3851363.1 terminase small subunit [Achromobacter denitrificans]MDF3940062.1 terminase small subunit [Achromobacter denitrificans]
MALTDKKRRFVQALQSGLSGAKAAIHAGYSEKGAAVAASRLMKDKDVREALGRVNQVNKLKEEAAASGKSISLPDLGKLYSDPLEFLKAVANDPEQDMKLRVDAAKAWVPYVHGKIGEQGKKDAKKKAAGEAAVGGKFGAPPRPPHLRVVGKG